MVRALAIAALVYLTAYAALRQTQQEVWVQDGRPYVIFPAGWPALWYAFRPATLADARLTGMQFHIGPHR